MLLILKATSSSFSKILVSAFDTFAQFYLYISLNDRFVHHRLVSLTFIIIVTQHLDFF